MKNAGDYTLQQIEDAQATPGTARRLVIDEVEAPPYAPQTRLRKYWEETECFNLVKDGEPVKVVVMSGSNMGKTGARELARALADRDDLEELSTAALENIRRTVTGRTPSRGPEPWRMTRSRYQAEAIHNGDLVIVKGTSVGVSWAAPTYGANICAVCGCVHRSHHGYICNSCFDSIQRVEMKQAMDNFTRASNDLARAFRDAGNAVGDGALYGQSLFMQGLGRGVRWGCIDPVRIFPMEPDARRFVVGHIEPRFDNFARGLAGQVTAACGVPLGLEHLPPTGLPAGNYFENILRRYGMECPRPAEPVMKRNKRNKGPKQQGKWWLK